MRRIFLSLFLSSEDAKDAMQELSENGYSQDQMKIFSLIGNLRGGYQQATIGTNADDRYADMKSELFRHLISWGVPKDDSFLFTEGVRRGEKLVVVFAEGLDEEKIAKIFDKHGALDLVRRKLYSEDLRHRPERGLSESPFTSISQDSTYEADLARWSQAHREELGPEVKVKAFTLPAIGDDKHLERNLNE